MKRLSKNYLMYVVHFLVILIILKGATMKLECTLILLTISSVSSSNYCNLQQKSLKLIASYQDKYVEFPLKNTTSSDNVTTFDITQNTSGMYIDVLNVLAQKCNFTYKMYVKNRLANVGGGDVVQTNNGFQLTGVYEDLINDNNSSFDGIWISKSMKPNRARFVTFLQAIENSRLAMGNNSLYSQFLTLKYSFIAIKVNSNDIDWWMFIKQIKLDIWITIIGTALVPSIILSFHHIRLERNHVKWYDPVKYYLNIVAANFGGGFIGNRNETSHHTATKLIILLSAYMSSIVFWIAYRASLTSGLTQEITQLPFKNLEELSQTDYILITARRGNSLANRFLYPSNLMDKTIRDRNIRFNESFVGTKVGLQQLLNQDNRALLNYESVISRELDLLPEDQQCEIKIIWKSDLSQQLSVAFRKDFEFIDNLNHALLQLKELGILQQIMKHKKVPMQCPKQEGGEPLGFKKMISIFVFIIASGFASMFIFTCEFCFNRFKL